MNLRNEEGLKQKVRLATLTLIAVTQITQGCTIERLGTRIKSNHAQIGILLEIQEKENQIHKKESQVLKGFAKILESHQQILED